MHLVIFELLPFTLQLHQLLLILLPYDTLAFLQSRFELRGLLDSFTSNKDLRGEHLDSGHKSLFFLLFFCELLILNI